MLKAEEGTPSKTPSSRGQILRSSSIIGGASFLNILIGLFRAKMAALILGPAGIGLIGLMQNLITVAAAAASFGMANVGTRQIAEASGKPDPVGLAAARKALVIAAIALSAIGGGLFWLGRSILAERVLGRGELSATVGWLAIGVALAVAFTALSATLNGLRRIGDLARVSVLSSLLATVVAIPALLVWGVGGVLVFVLATPICAFFVGLFFVSRLPKRQRVEVPFARLMEQWKITGRLGLAFAISGLALVGSELLVRTAVQRELGLEAAGYFQAAWMISTTYLGFVLSAMSTDYYPRLTAAIGDARAVNRMVNEQSHVALLLSAPMLLGLMGTAPWAIQLLYSSRFVGAASILQWQVLGDLLKIASWPIGFIFLALGHGRTFAATEIMTAGLFVGLTLLGLPILGLEATGVAFFGIYAIYLPVVFAVARAKTGFGWDRTVVIAFARVAAALLATFAAARLDRWAGAGTGVVLAGAFAFLALRELGSAMPGPILAVLRKLRLAERP